MVAAILTIPFPGTATNIDAGRTSPAGLLTDFVAGPENHLVVSVVEQLLASDVPQYSPLVFFGPSGSGKSHLALGLASLWKASGGSHRRSRRPAVYSTAIDFARGLASAVETQATDDFQFRYRQAPLVILDDVHLLATPEKDAAQQELIGLLDATEGVSWVVLTSSMAPEQLCGLDPRLQSRLVGGLAVPLALPGLEARQFILERIVCSRALPIEESAMVALAKGVCGPVSALAGTLAQLELAAKSDGGRITFDAVQQHLAQTTPAAPSLKDIAAITARHFAVKVADLRSPSRRRAVVTARDVAMYLARTLTGKSLKQIGQYFAGRDHTTVSHGCGKAEELLKRDPTIRAAVVQLRQRLQPGMCNTC